VAAAPPPPLLVAVHMGYGHLRAASALSSALSVPVLEADAPPLSGPEDLPTWHRLRALYESLSRGTEAPLAGPAMRGLLNRITSIPRLGPRGSQSKANASCRYLGSLIRKGFCGSLVTHLRTAKAPLLTTFYAPAVVADAAGLSPVTCVVTDSDVNRVWAPAETAATRIHFCVPTRRAERRLLAYGVPAARVERTGFPLPPALVGEGDEALRRNLAARLRRLDPSGAFRAGAGPEAGRLMDGADPSEAALPPRAVFAVGGAGAQRRFGAALLGSFAPLVAKGALRLTLVAATRRDARGAFERATRKNGLTDRLGHGLEVLFEETVEAYLGRFDAAIAGTDVLWTKPSELTFYAALGLPLVFSPSIGAQEDANRAWAVRRGAALSSPPPREAAEWLLARLLDGSLARAAWAGYRRLPAGGTGRILAAASSRHE